MADGLDIDHIARLARLRLTPQERTLYEGQLANVLGHFRQLAEADLSNTSASLRLTVPDLSLRQDTPGETLGSEAVLRNAPAARDGHISVPRVVDDEA